MLCVDRSVPVFGKTEDGNGSDKTINNEILTGISKRMASHGLEQGAFIYIADSAMVTKNPVWAEPRPTSYSRRSNPIRGCRWKQLSKTHPILSET